MTLIQTFIDAVAGITTLTIAEDERVVALRDGRLLGVYGPGRHRLPARAGRLTLERHDTATGPVRSAYEAALRREAPAGIRVVSAPARSLLVLFRDGLFSGFVSPGQRLLLWEGVGAWTVETVDLASGPEASPDLVARLGAAPAPTGYLREIGVPDGHVGAVTVDGVRQPMLAPGRHWFWTAAHRIEHRLLDLRWRSMEIAGQELLTQDRVTIRVNLTVEHRVSDPVKVLGVAEDAEGALYREVQLAFRRMLGAMSLDAILEKKAGLDAAVLEPLRARMDALGIELGGLALKDVVLPGEMRAILNGVVAAEKEAEATVIRRREETAATRALLNTARLMADNPVMLRLKELEALETIAARVDSLVVHNGPKGLLDDIARLG